MNPAVDPLSLPESAHDARPFRSHAQNFEDVVLWNALRDVHRGTYVDIGAYDPLSDSVSAGFGARGWTGLSVDPLPGLAERYKRERPDTEFLNAAVSDRSGPLMLSVVEGTGQSAIGGPSQARVEVPATSLARVLDKATEFGAREVHWLKIDVEGHEHNVIDSWGEQPARPWVMCVEWDRSGMDDVPEHPSWHAGLTLRGYALIRDDGINRFYCHENQPEHRRDGLRRIPGLNDGFLITQHSGLSELPAQLDSLRAERDSLNQSVERLDAFVATQKFAIDAGNEAQGHLHAAIRGRDEELASLRKSAAELRTQLEQAWETRDALHAENLRMQAELKTRGAAPATVAEKDLAAAHARAERLRARLAIAEDAHLAAMDIMTHGEPADRERIADLERQLDHMHRAHDSEREHAAGLQLQLDALRSREKHLVEEVARFEGERDQLLGSTSWRVTTPLRATINGAKKPVRAARRLRAGFSRPAPTAANPNPSRLSAIKAGLLDWAAVHWRRDYKLLRPLRMFVLRRPALGRRLAMRPDHWDDSYKETDPFDPDPEQTQAVIALQRAQDPNPNRYRGEEGPQRPRSTLFAPLSDTRSLTRDIKRAQKSRR